MHTFFEGESDTICGFKFSETSGNYLKEVTFSFFDIFDNTKTA